jgi:hypothetical protein
VASEDILARHIEVRTRHSLVTSLRAMTDQRFFQQRVATIKS